MRWGFKGMGVLVVYLSIIAGMKGRREKCSAA
jgi:hypothetical protein